MAAVGTARYGDLCRLCATKTSMILGINIFENEGTLRQIDKKIETCLPIQVHESDDLPKMICENCLYKLELFFEFRERSMRSENILITILKDIATKLAANHELLKTPDGSDVSSIEPCMITIHPPHPLMAEVQNINDFDLTHLHQRDDVSIHNEIILNHSSLDVADQALANIHSELQHHGSDLPSQEILVNGDYGVDGIQLIQQQHQHLLDEQYRLQPELNLNIIHEDSVCSDERSGSPNRMSDAAKQDHIKLEQSLKKEYFADNQNYGEYDERKSNNETKTVTNNRNKLDENKSGLENGGSLYVNHQNREDWVNCDICGSSFADNQDLRCHYDQHFNKCSECLTEFHTNEALTTHLKEAHALGDNEEVPKVKTRSRTAPVINERDPLDSNSESGGDINVDTAEEDDDDPETDAGESVNPKRKKWSPKECKECGKMYKTNYKLVEHMRKHTGEKPYKCSSCEKAFRSKIGLAQHEAKHTGQYDLSCPICGKGFQCKSYLMVHQRVHSDIKPYPCTTCGRNFKTKQSLLDHTNRHLGVKPYICDICGRGFITKGLCKAHQKVHTGLDNRKYSCKVCNKMFVSKSYLQTHLKIHTGEKPFICEVCGKGFLTRVDLRIHSTMHTGEKSFVCEICGKAFARRDALRCHRRSHTGERPYSCDQCGQTFTQFSPMAIHKRLHTGERPYTCEVCGKAFVSRSTMMSHWKKHPR